MFHQTGEYPFGRQRQADFLDPRRPQRRSIVTD